MKVLITPVNWGLGHATRDIPLIRAFLAQGIDVTLASSGNSLHLLQQEFPNSPSIKFDDCTIQYPKFNGRVAMFAKMILGSPKLVVSYQREHKRIEELVRDYKFDMVISDGRYGAYSKRVPSYIISHQITKSVPEAFNAAYFPNFQRVIVPDNHPSISSLSGKLARPVLPVLKKMLHYAGILCSIEKLDVRKDIDYLISVSGPEPHRENFANIVLEQVTGLSGKKVVVLGQPQKDEHYQLFDGTEVYSHVSREVMVTFMNQAKCVISRPGYTTVMELANIGTERALFVPTPGLPEQEHLARYYTEKNWFPTTQQSTLRKTSLAGVINTSVGYEGFPAMSNAAENAEKLVMALMNGL